MRSWSSFGNHTASPSRRDFLKTGVLGAAATAALGPAQAQSKPSSPAIKSFEWEEATLAQLAEALQSGKTTTIKLIQGYRQRIQELDKSGPAVNAVIELNPDALKIAAERDQERYGARSRTLGPLHGIPVLIKDNIATADAMTTTAGSLALQGVRAKQDAGVVQKLRAAGAVILGKTNLSEWANIRSAHSISGWSGRGGLTHNPYALDRNACGSSTGSGVAVAANFCAVAVGTETDGSVVCPSATCGIVGIKPTLGLVSRSGIIPIAHSQDTAGPMARTVADAAALLTVMQGYDPADEITATGREYYTRDYAKFLDPAGLRGARIGVVRKYFGFNDFVDKLMEEALAAMKHAGAEIVDPVEIESIGKFDESELEVMMHELKADLEKYLAAFQPDAPVKTLADVIAFNEKNAVREMPWFGQDLFLQSQKKGPLTSPEYINALEQNHRLTRKEGIDAVMDKHRLNALVAPVAGPAWLNDMPCGDHAEGNSTSLPAVAGYPNISVPAGEVFGLPIGISFFGRAFSEPVLIKIAYAFEQTTKHRKPPRFLPTIDLKNQ
jgi:amidase